MCSDKLHALELSLTIGCRLNCRYCPQKLLLEKYFENDKKRNAKLKFEDFKVVLEKIEKNATISFCGMSEPFHNDECADMIAYAYKKGYKISLLTTLVGMRMQDFEKIKDIEFDSFVLHIPDAQGNTQFQITEEYLKLLKLVNENIKIDYYSCHGTVHNAVREIIDEDKYAGIALANRAGNLMGNEIPKPKVRSGEIVCYHGSEKQIGGWAPVMLPDGTLVLCCQDYGMKHILGNLIKESWNSIENGKEYQYFKAGLKDSSKDILCRRCSDARMLGELPAMQIRELVKKQSQALLQGELENGIINKLARAEHVAVFGLGKLFRDHFFQEYWNIGLNVEFLVDNNVDLQGAVYNGLPCISPEQLRKLRNVLVIIFTTEPDEIMKQLETMGINNSLSIDMVIEEFNQLNIMKTKKLSL